MPHSVPPLDLEIISICLVLSFGVETRVVASFCLFSEDFLKSILFKIAILFRSVWFSHIIHEILLEVMCPFLLLGDINIYSWTDEEILNGGTHAL